jgi:hypothetical protein
LTRDVIRRGSSPCTLELSEFTVLQCGKGRTIAMLAVPGQVRPQNGRRPKFARTQ